MMPERCLEIAGLDLHYVVEQIQPSTDWPQLFVNASGVLIAALVAIWVAGAQHRRQVLQQTRQEVAAFLDAADKCVNHVHTRRLRESSAHEYEDWKAAQDRLTSKMYVVRLTAPHRIYVLASSVDHHVQTIIQSTESIMKFEVSGREQPGGCRSAGRTEAPCHCMSSAARRAPSSRRPTAWPCRNWLMSQSTTAGGLEHGQSGKIAGQEPEP